MATTIDGPRLNPKSGPVKQLVVFLHGYGADGQDLIELGAQWRQLLPQAAFVAPHAPDRCMQSPSGRQWFPLYTRAPDERWRSSPRSRVWTLFSTRSSKSTGSTIPVSRWWASARAP